MKRTLQVLSLAICLLALYSPAVAKNMHGKFGAGYGQTLLGVQGLTFGYWSSPELQLGLTVGSGFVLDPDNNNTTTILAALGMKYVMVATKFANLSAGIRLDLGWASRQEKAVADGTDTKVSTNVTQWGLDAPIEVEYFFSDAFSVYMATGITFTIVPKGGPVLKQAGLGAVDQEEYKGVGLGVGGLFGSAGFSFYF